MKNAVIIVLAIALSYSLYLNTRTTASVQDCNPPEQVKKDPSLGTLGDPMKAQRDFSDSLLKQQRRLQEEKPRP
ncbi:MAG: hypothetical protein ACREU9_04760 [Gammaproteobacteria bacterium]